MVVCRWGMSMVVIAGWILWDSMRICRRAVAYYARLAEDMVATLSGSAAKCTGRRGVVRCGKYMGIV